MDGNRDLSLGEYFRPGSPQEIWGARTAFSIAIQKNHQNVLRELVDFYPQVEALTAPIFEVLAYDFIFPSRTHDHYLGRARTLEEKMACDQTLSALRSLLARHHLDVDWVVEQVWVTFTNWQNPEPPGADD